MLGGLWRYSDVPVRMVGNDILVTSGVSVGAVWLVAIGCCDDWLGFNDGNVIPAGGKFGLWRGPCR